MKKTIIMLSIAALGAMSLTGCIEEFEPQGNNKLVSVDQAGNAPGAFNNFVDAINNELIGYFTCSGSSSYANDFGYPAFMIMNDIMGQDMVVSNHTNDWFDNWYASGVGLGPQYFYCQYPLRAYYGWILNCNNAISLAGQDIPADKRDGAGIAYAMRAMFYMDCARMWNTASYAFNTDSLSTIIQVSQDWSPYFTSDGSHNPRVTNQVIWDFILSDLDMAEDLIKDYKRTDIYTPNISVVYGLKARAYLETCQWAKAKEYAEKAMVGYTPMTSEQYTSKTDGFNKPNSAWIFGLTYKPNDPCIVENDADTGWGAQMINEMDPSTNLGGYGNYNGAKLIDRHLWETIPETDCRKMCYVDFAIDQLGSEAEKIEALRAFSDYPEFVYNQGYEVQGNGVGGIALKFRAADDHINPHTNFCVAIPLMRVEEMMLIRAEAAGMLNEAEGIQLLTEFGRLRDPNYVYGLHNEAYGNSSTSAFQNECWWQRRVELWGEGFGRFDIKRLHKGIIRSYKGTNHAVDYRWNTQTPPQWMINCYVGTEADYNYSLIQNPTPVAPKEDSPEFVW